MTELVPPYTTCKPWAAVVAGSTKAEDAEDAAGAYPSVRACKTSAGLGNVQLPCSSSSGSY
jgi:hypothetical protein